MSLGNLIWKIIPGNRNQRLKSELWIEEKAVQELVTAVGTGAGFWGDLLRSNVECASKLLTGRAGVEGISAPGLFSHQRFILWHSCLNMCKCYLVLTSIPGHSVREDLEHKTDKQRQDALRLHMCMELVAATMDKLQSGPKRPETRHKSCPIESQMYQESAVLQ